MPPKAAKFRIRRTADSAAKPAPGVSPVFSTKMDDGFGDKPFPTAAAARSAASAAGSGASAEAEIAAIRAEGLSGRQLRLARRVAQKHGIAAQSDHEAVWLLRKQGLDPFEASAIIGIIGQKAEPDARIQLPQTLAPGTQLPAQPLGDGERAKEIMAIQRDIVRRRKRNVIRLFTRLAIFVGLPTLVAGIYYYFIATPFYATKSEFIIEQADNPTAGLGSMFRGTQFATSQDSIAVQGYLQSRAALQRLDADQGFKQHFQQSYIDPIQRLGPDATNEEAYRTYKRNVKIGYDPTEGIIKLEVIAADPASSERFAKALTTYAEQQVDQLSSRLREDQMKGARGSYDDAERKVQDAQQKVLDLQQRLGILDPRSETNTVMTQIATFEIQLQQKQLELNQLLDNAQPNAARVAGAKGDITRLKGLIADLRQQLTEGTNGDASLAQVMGELRIAEADLETRQSMVAQALLQLETARIEANRQVRYLATSVNPVAPDEPTYPRAFEDTLLAFLIFGGIYLMVSLTASILKEQATA